MQTLSKDSAETRQPDSGVIKASVAGSFLRDQPAGQDHLGFAPYVAAVATFLCDPQTSAPLTLSIEGEWGSGKSSFMKQLRQAVEARNRKTVWFDAWWHEKNEALWASFYSEFVRQVTASRFVPLKNLRISWKRLALSKVGPERLRALLTWAVDLFVLIALFAIPALVAYILVVPDSSFSERLGNLVPGSQGEPVWNKLVPVGSLLVAWLPALRSAVGNVLSTNLRKYFHTHLLPEQTALLSQFQDDLRLLVEVYGGTNPIYVFIDDLDRCEPAKAAELMQAMNQMIADNPQLIFILGMDTCKIAAGFVGNNDRTLPYLGSYRRKNDDFGGRDERSAIEYGLSFIEKFIQVSFTIPRPTNKDLGRLLDQVLEKDATEKTTTQARLGKRIRPWLPFLRKLDSGVAASMEQAPSSESTPNPDPDKQGNLEFEERRARFELELNADSALVRSITMLAAPIFDFNPRRLKRFVNLFRLRSWIAFETGLFHDIRGDGGRAQRSAITPQQLGKFVIISLQWPQLLFDLQDDPRLLEGLESYAHDPGANFIGSAYLHWTERPKLMALLRDEGLHSPDKPAEETQSYSFKGVDIQGLIRIAPRAVASGWTDRSVTHRGQVSWIEANKGYGYIELDDHTRVWFHFSAFVNRAEPNRLRRGDEVEFHLVTNDKGPCAERIRVRRRATGPRKDRR